MGRNEVISILKKNSVSKLTHSVFILINLMRNVNHLFTTMQETDAVRAMKLEYLSNDLSPTSIDAQAFRNIKNLKLLILRNITFSSDMFEYSLNKFKWILSRFGIKFLVKDGLVGLDTQHSCIKHLGNRFR